MENTLKNTIIEAREAQEKHECDMCHGTIAPGFMYMDITTTENGMPYQYDMHVTCVLLASAYCKKEGFPQWTAADIQNWVQDEMCANCCGVQVCKRSPLQCPNVLIELLPPLKNFTEET